MPTVVVLIIMLVLILTTKTLQGDPNIAMSQQPLAPETIKLEVVAILPDDSDNSLSLSKTLSRTLNTETAADLLSHLYFPEKNLTWRVKNYVVVTPTNEPLHGFNTHSNSDSFNSDVVNDGSNNNFGSSESENSSEEDEDELFYYNDEERRRPGMFSGKRNNNHRRKKNRKNGGKSRAQTKGKGKWSAQVQSSFTPLAIQPLCDFLSQTNAVAILNLIGDASSERLLSLVSSATALPLIGSSQFANPLQTVHKVSLMFRFISSFKRLFSCIF